MRNLTKPYRGSDSVKVTIQEEPKKNIYVSIEAEFNFESCQFDYVRTLINPTKSPPPFPKYYSYVAPN